MRGTPVRDLHHLEELSAATAFGSFATDVVLALDRARTVEATPADSDSQVLHEAAHVLLTLVEPDLKPGLAGTASGLAATETAHSAVTRFLENRSVTDLEGEIRGLAAAAEKSATGSSAEVEPERFDALIGLFGRVSAMQLAESAAVLTAGKGAEPWTAMQLA